MLFFEATSPLLPTAQAGQDLPSAFGFKTTQPPNAPLLRHLLLQEPETPEGFAARAAVRNHRLPVSITHCRPEDLGRHARLLRGGNCLAVGTAPFLRFALQVAGLPEPEWSQWPPVLQPFMLNHPRCMTVRSALTMPRPVSIAPVAGHPFQPFVLRSPAESMPPTDRAQLRLLRVLDPHTAVLVTRCFDLDAEWRYYVLRGEVIGFAACTPNAQDRYQVPPGLEDVCSIVASVPGEAAFSMDIGVLTSGESTLLRVHDPLHTELIPVGRHRPSHLDFLRMLWVRWVDLVRAARTTS